MSLIFRSDTTTAAAIATTSFITTSTITRLLLLPLTCVGFRKLPVELQIKLAQNSVYPVTLIFHSKYYNLATGEYNWFINTPAERDLVLGILPPFAALGSHFSSTGFTLKTLALSDEEMAFLAAMAVLSATGQS